MTATTRPIYSIGTDEHLEAQCKLTRSNESLAQHLAESVNLSTTCPSISVPETNPSLIGTLVDALPPQSVAGVTANNAGTIDVSLHGGRGGQMAHLYENPVDLSATAASGASSGSTPPPGGNGSITHSTGGGKSRRTHKHLQHNHQRFSGSTQGGAAGARYTAHSAMTSGCVAGRGRPNDYMVGPPPPLRPFHSDIYSGHSNTANNSSLEHQTPTRKYRYKPLHMYIVQCSRVGAV